MRPSRTFFPSAMVTSDSWVVATTPSKSLEEGWLRDLGGLTWACGPDLEVQSVLWT